MTLELFFILFFIITALVCGSFGYWLGYRSGATDMKKFLARPNVSGWTIRRIADTDTNSGDPVYLDKNEKDGEQ
jgi:hypothetical protein